MIKGGGGHNWSTKDQKYGHGRSGKPAQQRYRRQGSKNGADNKENLHGSGGDRDRGLKKAVNDASHYAPVPRNNCAIDQAKEGFSWRDSSRFMPAFTDMPEEHVEHYHEGGGGPFLYSDACENFVLAPDSYNHSLPMLPDHLGPEARPSCEIKATVEEAGFISFQLRSGVIVNIAPNYAVEIVNSKKDIRLSLSSCATQMALVHPQGRVLQYNARVEVQSRGFLSEKSAKIWPRGISFTSNQCALVYLVDQAGARSTSDYFHDLYAEDIASSIFTKSCELFESRAYSNGKSAVMRSIEILENVDYSQSETGDCWTVDDACVIQQTFDGFVSVERKYGNELFTLKTSPSNGKARLQSSFLYVTASQGEESHLFVKSNDRRIHHSSKAFVVRNAGHSAGFDEKGLLRIW